MPSFIFSHVPFLVLLAHSTLCQPEGDSSRHEDNEVLPAESPVLLTPAPPSVPDHMYVRLPRLDTKDKLRLWIMKHSLSFKARDSCPAQVTDSIALLQAELAEVKKLLVEQTDSLRTLTRGQNKLWEERKRQQKRHVQTKKILKRVYRSCKARPASGDVPGRGRQREPAQRDQPDSSGPPPQDFSLITLPPVASTTEAGHGVHTTDASVPETEESSEEPTSVEESMVILDEEGDTMEVNLTSGVVRGNQTGMTWLTPLKKGRSEVCSFQGVLKATFTPPGKGQGREKLQIDLWMEDATDWVFNLGDSEGNDGRSGDGPLQENDCEVEVKGSGFFVYASDRAADPLDKLLFGSDYFLQGRLTLTVSDETLAWDNHLGGQKTLSLPTLFALAGQSDKQGPVNFDVFLGLNRVVAGKYRSGHGLCYLTIKWV